MAPLLVAFVAGVEGAWRVDRSEAVIGDGLSPCDRLDVLEGEAARAASGSAWVLRGVASSARYSTRRELDGLRARQAGLSRPEATRAALIPVKKTAAWWTLAQDERRAILEERSRHIAIGAEYLPAVARRLHHGRDLGEPFDFLTWFEYAPESEPAFDELLARLRASEEWAYVEREVDLRLSR
jgi:chlorite dismutase